MMLQDADGQVLEAHSASAGLDYPGVGPQIAALAAAGRLEVEAATDGEAFEAMRWLSPGPRGSCPALESAHALAVLPRLLAGDRPRPGARVAGGGDRPRRPFRSRRQGPVPVRPLARGARDVSAVAAPPADVARTGRPAPGALPRPSRPPTRPAGSRSSRTSSPATRTRPRACGSPRRDRRRRRPPRGRPAVLRSARRRRDPPARVAGRARNGATLEGSLRLIEEIAAARPATPIVPMGYANQFLGGGDGRAAADGCRGRAPPA